MKTIKCKVKSPVAKVINESSGKCKRRADTCLDLIFCECILARGEAAEYCSKIPAWRRAFPSTMLSALTRTVVRPDHALIAPDGYVPSVLPGWSGCTIHVQISAQLGARFAQWQVTLEKNGRGEGATFGHEFFIYVLAGSIQLGNEKIGPGGYAYLPPGTPYSVRGLVRTSRLLVFRKRYEPLAGVEAPSLIVGNEAGRPEAPFLGDPQARLKTLLPDEMGFDLAINIFTYDPGASLPFVETHIMEHGMVFLTGGGVYRLGDHWYPVQAGDALWIAPYCPQWFIAAGPGPARYIYYKDVNRQPL